MGRRTLCRISAALIALQAGASCSQPDAGTDAPVQMLADRIEIEDLLRDVYDNVETASTTDFDRYYVADAVFDVNGTAYRGKQAILDYHAEVARTSPMLEGSFHMLVDNLRVEVTGDTATVKLLFTGILSRSVTGPPELFKHGREYDLLERQTDGSWKLAKRVIVSDASAESDFAGIDRPGEDYDILAER